MASLIYNNGPKTAPAQFGNTLFKSNRFDQWFSNVVIAQDKKGQLRLFADGEQRAEYDPHTADFSQANVRWGAV